MRRGLQWTIIVLIMVLIGIIPYVTAKLPLTGTDVFRQYDGWSGVLRIWVCESFTGGIGTWLNQGIHSLEAAHPGVYVEVRRVTLDELKDMSSPYPDAIFFAPGMIEHPEEIFLPITGEMAARGVFVAAGQKDNISYAAPMLAGAYGILINHNMLPQQVTDWQAAVLDSADSAAGVYALACGRDTWAGSDALALMAMLGGLDGDFPQGAANLRGDKFPSDFGDCAHAQAFNLLSTQKAAAMVATQRDISDMTALAMQNKGFDFRVETPGDAICDQVLMYGIVNALKSDTYIRSQLCAQLANILLSKQSQEKLSQINLFSVRGDVELYQDIDGMDSLERNLAREDLIVPNAYIWAGVRDSVLNDVNSALAGVGVDIRGGLIAAIEDSVGE